MSAEQHIPLDRRDWSNPREAWQLFLEDFDYHRPNYRLEFLYDELAVVVKIATVDTYSVDIYADPDDHQNPREFLVLHRHGLPFFFQDDQWALAIVRNILHRVDNHETDEWIRYKGEMVFDPHRNDR